MIHPPKDQKRKLSEPSEGTPDDPASSSMLRSDPPARAMSAKLSINMSPGSSPLTLEQRRKVLVGTALYFKSIGWLVQKDGRGITISQPNELTGRQNVSGSEN